MCSTCFSHSWKDLKIVSALKSLTSFSLGQTCDSGNMTRGRNIRDRYRHASISGHLWAWAAKNSSSQQKQLWEPAFLYHKVRNWCVTLWGSNLIHQQRHSLTCRCISEQLGQLRQRHTHAHTHRHFEPVKSPITVLIRNGVLISVEMCWLSCCHRRCMKCSRGQHSTAQG